MTALGFTLLLVGLLLVVAEAHAPGGVLGVTGGVALIVGGIIVIAALGGGAAVAVPVGAGLGVGAVGWGVFSVRRAARSKGARVRAGTEALCGRLGIVRSWTASGHGQVFLDGTLWRARNRLHELDDEQLHEGDTVVVERVNGLTLAVRRAEDWELVT